MDGEEGEKEEKKEEVNASIQEKATDHDEASGPELPKFPKLRMVYLLYLMVMPIACFIMGFILMFHLLHVLIGVLGLFLFGYKLYSYVSEHRINVRKAKNEEDEHAELRGSMAVKPKRPYPLLYAFVWFLEVLFVFIMSVFTLSRFFTLIKT